MSASRGLTLLLLFGLLLGCRARCVIDSVPRGATVLIDERVVGETPLVIDLTSHRLWMTRRSLRVHLPGYRDRVGVLATRYDRRHIWTWPGIVLPWMWPVLVHPGITHRVKDYYCIILDEALGDPPPLIWEEFQGRMLSDDNAERRSQRRRLLEGGPHAWE